MRKHMRKVIFTCLAVLMLCSLSIVAFAGNATAENSHASNITVQSGLETKYTFIIPENVQIPIDASGNGSQQFIVSINDAAIPSKFYINVSLVGNSYYDSYWHLIDTNDETNQLRYSVTNVSSEQELGPNDSVMRLQYGNTSLEVDLEFKLIDPMVVSGQYSDNLTFQVDLVIPNCTHENVWYQYTVSPTCDENGLTTVICYNCGHEETQILPSLGHDVVLTKTAGTCVQRQGYTKTCNTCEKTEILDLSVYRSNWIEAIPEGFDPTWFVQCTQYRARHMGTVEWSPWYDGQSDAWFDLCESVDDIETLVIEERTLYRMKAAPYGEHELHDGVCIHCGETT
jgi:hypothetical protein